MHRFRTWSVGLAVVAMWATCIGSAVPEAQSTSSRERSAALFKALERLPYYGVFDFLAFSYDRGTVTLVGYAYRGDLRKDAEQAVKRVAGVDTVVNTIEELPASQNDDRIRWATFWSIYTDDFLSRYVPGGVMAARYDAMLFARYPGMQQFGGNYPIHIIVKGG